jgi:hypothetical protein
MRPLRCLWVVLTVAAAGCSGSSAKPSHGAAGSGGAPSASDASTGSGGRAARVSAGDAGPAAARTPAVDAGDPHVDAGAATDLDAAADSGAPDADLTGLIHTSGSHVVFTSQPIADFRKYPPSSLLALDLQSGEAHDLGAGGALSYTAASSDQSMLFCSGANAASDSNLFIVRLTDQGVVPATPISGFGGRPGNEYLRAWTGDSRYALFVRGSNLIGDGVDVVDTRTNSLLWYADTGLSDQSAGITVAPTGPWFAYWLGTMKREPWVARIERTGVTTMKLPADANAGMFDETGTRLAYSTYDSATKIQKLFIMELGGATQPLGDVGGYAFASIEAFLPGTDRVLVSVQASSTDHFTLESLSTGSGAPMVISDKTRTPSWRVPSTDFSSFLILYTSASSQDLELVDPTGAAPALPIASYPADAALVIAAVDAQRFSYTVNADRTLATNAELHIVQRDGSGGVLNSQLNMPAEIALGCSDSNHPKPPASKLVFMDLKTFALNLIDLSGKTPKRVATLAPSLAGATQVFCPQWGPKGDAFAYSELSATTSRIRLVRWGSGAPEAPKDVYDTAAAVEVVVARP